MASIGEWDFRLARIRVPTLVMEGSETEVPLEATRVWAAVAPNARLLLIPQGAHEFFVDQLAAFLRAAEQFPRGAFRKRLKSSENPARNDGPG